jgi:hypothetical protein
MCRAAGSDVSEVLARLRVANEELADALSAKERHLLDARAAEEKAASMEGGAQPTRFNPPTWRE